MRETKCALGSLVAVFMFALCSPVQAGGLSLQHTTNFSPIESGWEYYQGSLGSLWEIWRGDKATDNVAWKAVTLPHCFNGRDSVDPDTRYYQGPGWYRTTLKVSNPYAGGRTLLHFNGAGQKTEVYVGLEKVGDHNGGYDEWSVDITDAAARELAKSDGKGDVRVAVRCDNSRDAESIPSDLSDFNRYGGIYRHLYLVYVPRISVERVHVEPALRLPEQTGSEAKATAAWWRTGVTRNDAAVISTPTNTRMGNRAPLGMASRMTNAPVTPPKPTRMAVAKV